MDREEGVPDKPTLDDLIRIVAASIERGRYAHIADNSVALASMILRDLRAAGVDMSKSLPADKALAAMVGLCQTIEAGVYVDPFGHPATMAAAYLDAVRELEALGLWPAPPRVAPDIPTKPI